MKLLEKIYFFRQGFDSLDIIREYSERISQNELKFNLGAHSHTLSIFSLICSEFEFKSFIVSVYLEQFGFGNQSYMNAINRARKYKYDVLYKKKIERAIKEITQKNRKDYEKYLRSIEENAKKT
jgi:hypothetical protein